MQLRDLFDEMPETGNAVIPMALQQLLRQDLDVSEDWRQAEMLLLKARQALPEQLEVQIALYKLYAYSNRFEESLQVIAGVLSAAARAEGFSADWKQLNVHSAQWSPARGRVRQFLYSLKATGFVCLRSGNIPQAFAVLSKLLELDPQDQVGGSVVYELAESLLDD